MSRFFSLSIPIHLFSLILLIPSTVYAEEMVAALATEEDFLGDIPVVLSVTRLAQPKSDAPASITVIDRAMIEASGIRDIPKLLRLVPGFQVGHDVGSVLAPVQTPVTYHGYSDGFSRKMQVLVDGRSVYEPFLGGVRWSELGLVLDDIERIEVIRGPNGASYGSNAVLGAINIITRHPSQDTGTTVGLDTASNGYRQGVIRYNNNSDSQSYRLTGFYTEDSGFDGRHDGKNTTGFSYRGEKKFGSNDTLDIFLGMNQGLRQLGDNTTEYPNHDRNVNSNYQQLKWTRRNSADNELSFQLFHNYFQFNNAYIGPYSTAIDASTKTHRWDAEFQHIFRANKDLRFVWGLGARMDQAQAAGWFGTNDWLRNYVYRSFVNGEWVPSPKWTINMGALAEQSSVAETTLSPRLAANYHLSPGHTVRAAVSQGHRNPALFEEHANTTVYFAPVLTTVYYFYSDGAVKSANVTNYELGYLVESGESGLSMDIKAFLMQFRDSIAYPGGGGTYQYTYKNGGDSNIYGAEVQLKIKPTRRTTTTLSYAYAKHQGWYISSLPSTTGVSDQSTPNHTFSFLLDQKLTDQWSAGFFYHFVSDMTWFSGNKSSGYHIANVRLAREFKFGSKKGNFEVIGQNIAGEYFDISNQVISKPKLFIGVRLPL